MTRPDDMSAVTLELERNRVPAAVFSKTVAAFVKSLENAHGSCVRKRKGHRLGDFRERGEVSCWPPIPVRFPTATR